MSRAVVPYVVDYPEARATYDYLQKHLRLPQPQVLPGLGERPDSISVQPHSLTNQPFLFLNGSGKFHHDTAPVVEGFLAARPEEIYYYVQIDAHPDKEEVFRWKLDCANFVGRLMQQKQLRRFFLLGTWPPCLDVADAKTNITKKIRCYRRRFFKIFQQYVISDSDVSETFFGIDEQDLVEAQNNPSVATAAIHERQGATADDRSEGLVVTWKTLDDFSPTMLKRPVYLSIDLDVLKSDLVTDWRVGVHEGDVMGEGYGDNHGRMSLEQLLALIKTIGETASVQAGDICGVTEMLGELSPAAREKTLETVKQVYEAMLSAIQPASP